jgi:hypothetical protein
LREKKGGLADTSGQGMILQMIRRAFRRILTPPMVGLAVLFILAEEWIWDNMTAAMALVARLPIVRRMEGHLSRLPAWAAVACFFLPGLLLLPVKIGALFLMGRGHVIAGVGVVVAAKVAGTAVVARFFTVCKPTLLGVNWFRSGHDWILRIKVELLERLRAMPVWQKVVVLRSRIRRWMGKLKPGMIARRWKAIGGRLRRLRGRRLAETALQPVPAESQAVDDKGNHL